MFCESPSDNVTRSN